jgi:hypothetical protein
MSTLSPALPLRWGVLGGGGSIIVLQDRICGTLQVVELAALERAPEHPADQEYERD